MQIYNILAADKEIILYRKELNQITGSVTATLLLQQAIYRFTKNNNKPFYKFIEPCNNEKYKDGDSWCEELGFTKYEFKSAYQKLEDLNIISKKTNMMRVTFYDLNLVILDKLIKPIYESRKNQSIEVDKTDLEYSKSFEETETTTETTTEKENKNKEFLAEQEIGRDSDRIALYLLNHILKINPKFAKPDLNSWAKEIDKAILVDKRTVQELKECIEWVYSTKDGSFWQSVIINTAKLREKFDQMNMQAITKQPTAQEMELNQDLQIYSKYLRKQGLNDNEIMTRFKSEGLVA